MGAPYKYHTQATDIQETFLNALYNPKHPPEMPGIDLQNAQSSQLKLQGWRILDTFENEDIALTCLTHTVHYPLKASTFFHLIYRATA